ncbi:cuticle protein 7-like [Cloeon dipterum]|uniref:Cuticle protein 16.8 n=1 Tax=Cloeon dipterum TaxID=197152 RepID=A0A8S1C0C9_9INSE|nr:Hypothetical predicted protein [Cloeon dipterum]
MEHQIFIALIALTTVVTAVQQVAVIAHQEEELPPQPYAFSYAAGRAPGHVDRTHSETKDEFGVVRGQFSYVDPRNRIRTVNYVADAAGFHPVLNTGAAPVTDTPVVAAAKLRHLALAEKIAADHARIAAERAALAPPSEQILDGHL